MDSPELGKKSATLYVEDVLGSGAVEQAKDAFNEEHQASFWSTLKKYRRAVFWSCVISMSVVMEGYDTILIGNFWAYPAFKMKYGQDYGGTTGYQVPAHWQAGLSDASTVGTIFGALCNGWAVSRYGYRKVMIVSLFLMNAFVFVVFFAPSVQVLLVGELLCGLTWGVFATTGPAYASEVAPLALRSYLTVYVNLCWAIGQFIAAGVLKSLVNDTTEWAYRIPFAIQWVWPIPLMVLIIFAPESPWFYVRKDSFDEAKKMIHRLGELTEAEATGTLSMLVHTVKLENEMTTGSSYFDCFRGTNLRRTEIACVAFAGQILSGSSFAYSPTYFFTNAGLSTDNAYALGLGGTAFAFVGTVCSWFLIARFGRRTLYLAGQCIACTILLVIGIASVSSTSSPALWTQAAFSLIWILSYSLTIGPITYSLVAETSSVHLRAQTVVLARNFYQIVNIIVGILIPYMLNPTEWNWKGKTGFFWAGSALLMATWAYFRLPEPRNRTFEEMDILFAKGVSARQFSKTVVDPYADVTALNKTESE